MNTKTLTTRAALVDNEAEFSVDTAALNTAAMGLKELMQLGPAPCNTYNRQRNALLTMVNKDGRLHLLATDKQVFAEATIASQALREDADSTCTVDLRQLIKITKGKGRLVLRVNPKEEQLVLNRGAADMKLPLVQDDDSCPPPKPKADVCISLCAAEMASIFERALTCVDPKELRNNLRMIHFKGADKKIHLAATDGHRLYWHRFNQADASEGSVLAPRFILATLAKKRMLAGLDTQVSLRLGWGEKDKGNGSLAIDFVRAGVAWAIQVGVLADGTTFPDVAKVTPTHKSEVSIKTEALMEKVKEINVLGKALVGNRIYPMALEFSYVNSHQVVGVISHHSESKSTYLAQVKGASPAPCVKHRIGFNTSYLLDGLTASPDQITLQIGGALAPIVIYPSDAGSQAQSPWLFVVMPLRLEWEVDFKPSIANPQSGTEKPQSVPAPITKPITKPVPAKPVPVPVKVVAVVVPFKPIPVKPMPRRARKSAAKRPSQRMRCIQGGELNLAGMQARWA